MARLSNVGCSKEPRRQTEPRCGNAANSGWQTGSFRYLGIPWRRTWRRRRTWSRTPVRLPCCLRDAELKNWSIADPRFPIRSCACVSKLNSHLSEQPPIRSGAHETGLPLQNSACLIRIALIGRGVVTPTRKPHLKLLRFKESGAYLGPGTRERRRTHVPDCTGTDACISNDKSLAQR